MKLNQSLYSPKPAWKEKPLDVKIADILSCVFIVALFTLFVLNKSEVWKFADRMYYFSLSMANLCQAYSLRKTNKSLAVMALVAALLIFAAFVLSFFA